MTFADRRDAGEALGRAVVGLEPEDPVVYALPRGGVPVGFEVARCLHSPLDVIIVRKIGVPYQPELAMGAIAEGGVVIRSEGIVSAAGIDDDAFDEVVAREKKELDHRVTAYRGDTPSVSPVDRTAIVVDDGIATGSTALAAVSVLREMGASSVWLAVPVAPSSPLTPLEETVDRLLILIRPRHFGAVGSWYRDFDQTTDDQVRDLLSRSRLP